MGVLEGEEACVEDLFDKLNKELGIREFDPKERIKVNPKEPIRTISKLKPKIPTPVDKSEPTVLYNILYTNCKTAKMTKTWQDGLLKYHPTLKLAEFYDAIGTLLHKKTMETVAEGTVIYDAGGGSITIEISSKREEITKSITTTTNTIRLFNILYTTDKHKKSKKWLDGRLEYDETTKLARFMGESTGDCFYKKIMAREMAVRANGEEFETGAYIIQIDHEIQDKGDSEGKENAENKGNDVIDGAPSAKRVKSIVANGSVPLSGRSNAELLSLLKNKKSPV